MKNVRRVAFHLTPLLDLLLIVIFAQYMEVSDTTARERKETAARLEALESQRDAAQARAERAATADAGRQRTIDSDLRQLRSENEALRQRQAELSETLQQAAEQRDRVGALTAALFNVPAPLLEQALGAGSGERSDDELQRLQARFEELAAMRPAEVVKHLLTYDELRKRADVWDLHLDEDGRITFTAGDFSRTFRAENPAAFAARLYEIYKSLPQPKGLVIMLLSYGDAKAVWRQAALQGLPQSAERMREDAGGRTRFEYAVLGFRPREEQETQP